MLINFDLQGAEWVVTAFLCRDSAMMEIARSKRSPHPITGSRMTGITPELVTADDKLIGKTNDPLVIEDLRRKQLPDVMKSIILPRTMSIRQMAKKANHGLNYREGYKTFALKNEIEEREARKIVSLYRDRSYPGLNKWYERIDKQIRDTRTMENCFGRKVYFMGQINDDMFRQATAFQPQSTVVDITNSAMVLAQNDDSEDFRPAELLAQVHDSLLFDYLSLDFDAMARFAIKMIDYLSPTIDYGEPFKLDVEMKAGLDWGKGAPGMEEVKVSLDPQELSLRLYQNYLKAKERYRVGNSAPLETEAA